MEEFTIRDYLNNYSINVVTFEKKDGSIRNMICTQDFDYIPEKYHPKIEPDSDTKPKKNLSDEVARVFDFESDGWRSFRYDSVIDMNFYVPRVKEETENG